MTGVCCVAQALPVRVVDADVFVFEALVYALNTVVTLSLLVCLVVWAVASLCHRSDLM